MGTVIFKKPGPRGIREKKLQKIDSLNEQDRMKIKVRLFSRGPY